ncbi:MAG: thiazole synthase [Spirochaetes bacterium GWF1_51_8]|nr:MAG: thiazole synthase [Spirochaetes bacterium GWF1_51_8]
MDDILRIGGKEFRSRFFLGTGKFSSSKLIPDAVRASGSELVTVAVRRVDPSAKEENMLNFIPQGVTVMANTSGARNALEAVRIARISRELGCGNFVKIEVIRDNKYLFPDNEETLAATKTLAAEGFVVMPYILPDPVLCRKLEDAGAASVMPLGSPIGTNKGIRTRELIEIIIENSNVPVVVDAGIGLPSHAAEAMEMGADAVLVNTAVATAENPVLIAEAFALGVRAGRLAFLANARSPLNEASPSSPLTGFLGDADGY